MSTPRQENRYKPCRPCLVANVVQAQVMENHGTPVIIFKLARDMPGDIVVHLGKVLRKPRLS